MRGLLLDLDGTVADTLPALEAVYGAFLAARGIADAAPPFARMNGIPLPEILDILRSDCALKGEPAELERDYRARMVGACANAQPVKGARELLQRARARDVCVAIVTSGATEPACDWLEHVDLASDVDVVIGADRVSRSKPAPDAYLAALAALDVEARDAVAVEDSPIGARSAVAAGLVTCVLASAGPQCDERFPPSVRFVAHLDEVLPAS